MHAFGYSGFVIGFDREKYSVCCISCHLLTKQDTTCINSDNGHMRKTGTETKRDRFFEQIRIANDRVLFVDYDGTIAPFHEERHRATPYRKIPEILKCIMDSCHTQLIIVSGRAASEVPQLLGIYPTPEIWGTHGIERRHRDGRYENVEIADAA